MRPLPVTLQVTPLPVERAHLEKSVKITYRMAGPDDSRDIARFMCIAGGGVYEFLFDDLIPFVTAVDLLSSGIGSEHYPISYRNCCVASVGHDGDIVAAANVFPADLLKEDHYVLFGSERHNHIRPMLELQDWGSMFLNSLAVSDAHRGSGIGAALLDWAEARTAEAGYRPLEPARMGRQYPRREFLRGASLRPGRYRQDPGASKTAS